LARGIIRLTGGEEMAFCSHCGKEVSEDVSFCPDCGERLKKGFTPEEKQKYIQELEASVKEEKPAEKAKTTKKKIAGIIVGCIVAIIVIIAIAAPKATPTPKYTLSASVSPSGTGSVSPSGGEYEPGAQVTMTANPASGYTFDYWSGSASGTSASITITMDSDKSITAYFKKVPPVTFTPIAFTGSSDTTTPPFTVTTSEWTIDWSYVPDPEYPDLATFGFFVYPRGETVDYVESVLFPGSTSGSTYSYAGPGEYYIKLSCANIKSWRITIKPP
jgi:uncharacterized repeat protein (TIGR02543 family)